MNETLSNLAKKSGESILGLQRILRCDCVLGNPSRAYASVHIAGTNGKGTVTSKIAKALSLSGYKTGHFLSPHIHTVCERIQIGGKLISPDDLDEMVAAVLKVEPDLTFFEALTAAAFLYFREQKVDYAVFETGLGGTYDATNILYPKLSVITNISYDHKHILGDTLDEIASNKAGIIKRGVPVVVGHRAALRPIYDRARELEAPLTILPPKDCSDAENEQIAKAALGQLQKQIKLESSCTDVCLPARFERVELYDGTYIFDMAHNEESFAALTKRLKKNFPNRKFAMVFAICSDKDLDACAKMIHEITPNVFLYPLNHPRATPVSKMKQYFPEGITGNFAEFLKQAKEQKQVIITAGSSFIIDPVKQDMEISAEAKDPHLLYD